MSEPVVREDGGVDHEVSNFGDALDAIKAAHSGSDVNEHGAPTGIIVIALFDGDRQYSYSAGPVMSADTMLLMLSSAVAQVMRANGLLTPDEGDPLLALPPEKTLVLPH
jgi:hypothetical protein